MRRLEPLGDMSVQAQAMQARPGEDHGVELPLQGLVQSGLDVSPDGDHLEIPTQVEQLGTAPQRAGSDPSPRGKVLEGSVDRGDQCIGNVLALGHRGEDQFLGPLRRQVLEAVDGDIHRAVKHGALDLLGEQPRAADRGQRRVLVAVTVGLDLDEPDIETGMKESKAIGNPLGLPAGQPAATGADPQGRRLSARQCSWAPVDRRQARTRVQSWGRSARHPGGL